MTILALDLGTNLGVCYGTAEDFSIEDIRLAEPREVTEWRKRRLDRRGDPRFTRLRSYLRRWDRWGADVGFRVVFEDVCFCTATYQCQLWASLRAAIWSVFPPEIVECVPVGTLKLFATGSGSATKSRMAKSMVASNPARFFIDGSVPSKHCIGDRETKNFYTDNAVDAYHIHRWAHNKIKIKIPVVLS